MEIEVLKVSEGGWPREEGAPWPRHIRAQVRHEGVEVQVEIALSEDEGRYVVEAISGTNLTSELLHALRVPEIIREAVLGVVFGEGAGPVKAGLWALLRGEREHPSLEDWPEARKLERVALVYQYAYIVGQRPTATVVKAFGLPRSTAGRLIRQARDQGLLGPTTERKAGV